MGAGDDAGEDYVMFMSSRVISLDMSHARVQILHDNGGDGVDVQKEALGNYLFLSFPQV